MFSTTRITKLLPCSTLTKLPQLYAKPPIARFSPTLTRQLCAVRPVASSSLQTPQKRTIEKQSRKGTSAETMLKERLWKMFPNAILDMKATKAYAVYIILFSDGHAYVGFTGRDPHVRILEHLTLGKSQVFKHIQEDPNATISTVQVVYEAYTIEEARRMEKGQTCELQCRGYKSLSKHHVPLQPNTCCRFMWSLP